MTPLSTLVLLTLLPGQIEDGFEPLPERVDLLVVVAHPDDEGTFGGLLPHYALCRDKSIAFVCLTSGEWGNGLPHHTAADLAAGRPKDYSYDETDYPRYEGIDPDAVYPCYYREGELSQTLKISGVPYAPIMPRFDDMNAIGWGQPDPAFELWGGRDRVVGFLVQTIRKLQPAVVVTMAYDGYNGNPQHMAASHGTIEAVEAAADASLFVDHSAARDSHTVSKLYLAVSEGERYDTVHSHRWTLPCPRLNNRSPSTTPQEVAARANAAHASQEMKNECPATSDFVLQLSTVGPDQIGKDDLFENVQAGGLSND